MDAICDRKKVNFFLYGDENFKIPDVMMKLIV